MTGYGFTLPSRLRGLGDEATTGNSDDSTGGGFWDVYANAGVNPAYKGTQLSTDPPKTGITSLFNAIPQWAVIAGFAGIALIFVYPRGK